MCQFFSCISDGNGKIYYMDAKKRAELRESNSKYLELDSHTSIAFVFGLDDDEVNKWEYNPLTKKFTVDQINTTDDQYFVERALDEMDWAKIVPELIVKPIINPLEIERSSDDVTAREIALLKAWDTVWASVWDAVRDTVCDTVCDTVWDAVGSSVWSSVGASVCDTVWDAVLAYAGSFFDVWDGSYPLQCIVDLWESGLVPSNDGTTWRLHTGADARIVYEWTPD